MKLLSVGSWQRQVEHGTGAGSWEGSAQRRPNHYSEQGGYVKFSQWLNFRSARAS